MVGAPVEKRRGVASMAGKPLGRSKESLRIGVFVRIASAMALRPFKEGVPGTEESWLSIVTSVRGGVTHSRDDVGRPLTMSIMSYLGIVTVEVKCLAVAHGDTGAPLFTAAVGDDATRAKARRNADGAQR